MHTYAISELLRVQAPEKALTAWFGPALRSADLAAISWDCRKLVKLDPRQAHRLSLATCTQLLIAGGGVFYCGLPSRRESLPCNLPHLNGVNWPHSQVGFLFFLLFFLGDDGDKVYSPPFLPFHHIVCYICTHRKFPSKRNIIPAKLPSWNSKLLSTNVPTEANVKSRRKRPVLGIFHRGHCQLSLTIIRNT